MIKQQTVSDGGGDGGSTEERRGPVTEVSEGRRRVERHLLTTTSVAEWFMGASPAAPPYQTHPNTGAQIQHNKTAALLGSGDQRGIYRTHYGKDRRRLVDRC